MWQLGSPNYGDQTISETESQACHYKDSQIFLKSSRVPGTVICLINMTAPLYICICTNEWIIWISGKSINQMQVVFRVWMPPIIRPTTPSPVPALLHLLPKTASILCSGRSDRPLIPVKWPRALTSLSCSGGFPFSFTNCSTPRTAVDFSSQRRTAI